MPMGRNLYGQTEASGVAETGVPGENGFGGWFKGCWRRQTSMWLKRWSA